MAAGLGGAGAQGLWRPRVVAISMCFTGKFTLNMMKSVVAPVLSQPSLPMHDAAALAIHQSELARVNQRSEDKDLTGRAYRFEGYTFCSSAKFAANENALGDKFVATVLQYSAANPNAPLKSTPHRGYA